MLDKVGNQILQVIYSLILNNGKENQIIFAGAGD